MGTSPQCFKTSKVCALGQSGLDPTWFRGRYRFARIEFSEGCPKVKQHGYDNRLLLKQQNGENNRRKAKHNRQTKVYTLITRFPYVKLADFLIKYERFIEKLAGSRPHTVAIERRREHLHYIYWMNEKQFLLYKPKWMNGMKGNFSYVCDHAIETIHNPVAYLANWHIALTIYDKRLNGQLNSLTMSVY